MIIEIPWPWKTTVEYILLLSMPIADQEASLLNFGHHIGF